MASSKKQVSLVVVMVVLVVAANFAHYAVGIPEINNNPAGVSDGSDEYLEVTYYNSLKNNNPLSDITLQLGGLPHQSHLTCIPTGHLCSKSSDCCSGKCVFFPPTRQVCARS
ncbi:hypothetical protein Tsubulata_047570 [Turnera subulata]|uniref:Uncharacterized protein n=1 Tax=Turnera subulata TaxID=218843 RepID=A0A9Q0GJL6_9ROSI|nr:hypothetical protein Tsubulata_047570 [Turnera subulata]